MPRFVCILTRDTRQFV